ncbi:bifunctional diaminohydroxyphosphoribosylaminopyrimidine deaminase/5-amino-6-(5-phosphoribosylamino)uracil reductase RibD [Candidatus Fermentibacteria bacterium]|nr:bifunctional diaminohydroxyphosphoribosylaminopyrimidine deaminase/5-amino-6-(5-phosphoribosylamino)uracil reductase RibD [Candidatus Fermentibacteria bacterium]
MTEREAMERALELARLGRGRVFPNPMVGAVVLAGGEPVGEGFHACCGEAHAETAALERAGGSARGSTVVVSLEPCCHASRTGPCCEALAKAGVRRVVCAMEDPDPRVSGRGIAWLREHGIEVETGLMEAEAHELNRAYIHHRTTGRSLVTIKMAMSSDGMVAAADGSSRWITGPESRARVQEARAACDAVLVGAGTVRRDDPSFAQARTVIVVSACGLLDPRLALFRRGRALVVAVPEGLGPVKDGLEEAGAEVWETPPAGKGLALEELLRRAADRGLGDIVCEGGPTLAGELVSSGLADRFVFYYAPMLLGAEGLPAFRGLGAGDISRALELEISSSGVTGRDRFVEGRFVHGAR